MASPILEHWISDSPKQVQYFTMSVAPQALDLRGHFICAW